MGSEISSQQINKRNKSRQFKSDDCGTERNGENTGMQYDQRILNAFKRLSDNKSSIDYKCFEICAGPKLANALWKQMWHCDEGANCDEHDGGLQLQEFHQNAIALSTAAPAVFVRMLMPVQHLLECCLEAEGIRVNAQVTEDKFLQSLIAQMQSAGEDADGVHRWLVENCPRMLEPVRDRIHAIFYGGPTARTTVASNNGDPPACTEDDDGKHISKSELLSALQWFVLRQMLPTTIFWPKPVADSNAETTAANDGAAAAPNANDWVLLYRSSEDGLSVNRFESRVFDYRGPSLALFRLDSGELFAIAADEEWRHSCKPFGGPHSMLIKFQPGFEQFHDVSPPAIHCNFKNRTARYGLSYGRHFSIDGDLNGLDQIEVWGCAGRTVMEEQRRQKTRQRQQAERNARVPLPGNWDDNPDKAILEMGGVKFSSERRDKPDDRFY